MDRHTFEWHGRKYYFLGCNEQGERQYLEQALWECDWYWAIGYVETFTNNVNPQLSHDISCHTHFDTLMKEAAKKRLYHIDAFNEMFRGSPFTREEIWKILELIDSAYTARKYSDMLNIGGVHYTTNPVIDTIKNQAEYNRINKVVIPEIMNALYKILEGDEE